MSDCLSCFCKPIGSCFSCLLCDFLCCQCNCIIFPAPHPFLNPEFSTIREGPISTAICKFVHENKTIPYAEISTAKSRLSNKCFIYFHGNAQDIGLVGHFLEPIVEELNVTFYAIEYPTYSTYSTCFPGLISNTIKEDALAFYDYLIRSGRSVADVYVMGRSIGTGGATYLAGHKNIPLLVLMSPFDTIRSVAMGIIGCVGCVLKQHFNNEEEIVKFNGELLVIHGESDEVIGVQHGKNLVRTYELGNAYKNTSKTVYPKRMTHNSFDIDNDIIQPISHFINR